MVSKLSPTRLGRRNVFLTKSHVPSPTVIVSDEYVARPGGDKPSAGAIVAYCRSEAAENREAVVPRSGRAAKSVLQIKYEVRFATISLCEVVMWNAAVSRVRHSAGPATPNQAGISIVPASRSMALEKYTSTTQGPR